MFDYLGLVCPYHTAVQDITNGKMLRWATESTAESATAHVRRDLNNSADIVLASSSNYLHSYCPWRHQE